MNSIIEIKRSLNKLSYEGLGRVADRIGCHVETLARLRRGTTQNPSHKLIVSLARHYNINVSDFEDCGNSAANLEAGKENDS